MLHLNNMPLYDNIQIEFFCFYDLLQYIFIIWANKYTDAFVIHMNLWNGPKWFPKKLILKLHEQ